MLQFPPQFLFQKATKQFPSLTSRGICTSQFKTIRCRDNHFRYLTALAFHQRSFTTSTTLHSHLK